MSLSERLDQLFAHLEEPGMPGAAVAVLVDGEVVHRRGYGFADIEGGVAFTPETNYPIASMTKQFTTTCILLLEEEGRLSLGDDYRVYLPEMPDFGAPITIDNLCTNTSGIRDIFALVSLAGGARLEPRQRELVAEIIGRQRTLNFPTGSQYRYSNPNFQMLSWIIERITGQRLAEFMVERIFEPLGMRHTALQDLRDAPMTGGARAYDGGTRDDLRPTEWDAFARSGSGEGGGAIWSTLDDLIFWEQNFSHNIIGSPGLLDRLPWTPQIPGGDQSFYGRGLFVGSHRGQSWQGHSGGLGPYTCNRVRFPDAGLSVIMLSNSAMASPFLGVFDVADVYLDRRTGIEPAQAWAKTPAEDLEPWFGAYEDAETGLSFGLVDQEGTAALVWFGGPVPLETAGTPHFLALRGASLPTRVTPGPVDPAPEITVQLGPNPPVRMRRSQEPAGSLKGLEGEYFSDELQATHTVFRNGDSLAVNVESPLGRRGSIPLTRTTESGFIATYGPDQHASYFFPHASSGTPSEIIVTLARAERLRLKRVS